MTVICYFNLMMDSTKVIPSGFHFARRYVLDDFRTQIIYHDRRSVGPVKYYSIDYETAGIFAWGKMRRSTGPNRNVHEMSETVPYDPFKLGAIIIIPRFIGLRLYFDVVHWVHFLHLELRRVGKFETPRRCHDWQ
ncbi:hypothetical protein GALMADRAFT_1174105 [Galerina marginata CBS 339.88]|uniref:Uncharacterized protein n=1 Tax=Galerina marginata (strain CBS 339.88) TaxID=685588 RepID=A0A067TCE4_GALM3|nr:hypothetical protein GALMADRAFT_1174105 [Galerina marginata CBS 339.88]